MTAQVEEKTLLLKVEQLSVVFPTFYGEVRAIEDVEFNIRRREVVGLVGETGCGKTVTGYSILRLVPKPGRITRGKVILEGEDLIIKAEKQMRNIRGGRISMIFQRPMSSLNPMFTIGVQMADIISLQRGIKKKEALEIAVQGLEDVAMPDPRQIIHRRPYELSGGMQQRVLIALSIACQSDLMIADEPTTALDVSIQLQILKLLANLVDRKGLSILLISHDMAVIGTMCDRINVMYAGTIVESAPKQVLITEPAHPYTKALLNAVPEMVWDKKQRLKAIDGTVPSLIRPPEGCRFAPRCSYALQECLKYTPTLVQVGTDHYVRCHLFGGKPS